MVDLTRRTYHRGSPLFRRAAAPAAAVTVPTGLIHCCWIHPCNRGPADITGSGSLRTLPFIRRQDVVRSTFRHTSHLRSLPTPSATPTTHRPTCRHTHAPLPTYFQYTTCHVWWLFRRPLISHWGCCHRRVACTHAVTVTTRTLYRVTTAALFATLRTARRATPLDRTRRVFGLGAAGYAATLLGPVGPAPSHSCIYRWSATKSSCVAPVDRRCLWIRSIQLTRPYGSLLHLLYLRARMESTPCVFY